MYRLVFKGEVFVRRERAVRERESGLHTSESVSFDNVGVGLFWLDIYIIKVGEDIWICINSTTTLFD
jgi:hypothetical protein